LWAGVHGEGLEDLGRALKSAGDPFADTPDKSPFTPHITLGRFGRLNPFDRERVHSLLAACAERQFGCWQAREVILFHSELHPDGARHKAIDRWSLGTGDCEPPAS